MGLQFQKIVEDMAEQLGYDKVERLSSGHLEALHPNGARVRLPFTPRNEWREKRNARAALERGAGERLPRDRAGKRKGSAAKETFRDIPPTKKSLKAKRRDLLVAKIRIIDKKVLREIETNTPESYLRAKQLFQERRKVEEEASRWGIRIKDFRL